MRSTRSSNPRGGFTIMELIISMALTLVLLAGVWTMFDIFSSLQQRGERQTARARLTRGLYKQLQDDISQATLGNPPPDSNRIVVGQLAPPPQPVEETPAENKNNEDEQPKGDSEEPEDEEESDNSIGGLFSKKKEEDPNIAADAGSLGKKRPKQNNSPFSSNQSNGPNDSNGPNSEFPDELDPFGKATAPTTLPPEYAMVVGGPTWMILDLPIPKDDVSATENTSLTGTNSNSNSSGRSGGKWIAPTVRQRIIYHYVAPEDLLANDKLTLGLTRWSIGWQAAPIAALIEELRKDEFSTPNSVIWKRPKNSGAGSSLSFIASSGPPVDREEIPEIRRALFRYYSKKSGWSSQWNSVARRELPDAIQMRVLWHDPRQPLVDTSEENDRERSIRANTQTGSDSRYSSRDGADEAELLIEWDEDLERGYGKDAVVTSSSNSTVPPEGYAEYLFIIPASNRPIRPERTR